MKCLFVLISFFLSGIAFSQNKLALIVAIGEYAPDSRIPPIAAVNDVKYIKAALKKNSFLEKNIDTLINVKATKDAILQRLILLSEKAQKNDIVVLHFSCHGQQIRDQKTIELGKDEDDGYDEALLPYDAKAKYNPTGYKGEKHLRDDDLFPKLMAIRTKIGPQGNLLVLLDACHSGTGTRSESFATSRGMPDAFPDPENPLDSTIDLSGSEQSFFDIKSDSISNMVVICASSPHQENKQVVVNKEELGSLSYSFYKAISEMSAGNTYELLFEKIKATIQAFIPDQVPMIEGNINQLIFSGKYVAKEDKTFIRVGYNGGTGTEDSVFTIDKGLMDNMAIGTTCKIYKTGSATAYSNAVIKKVENFKSVGVADKKLKKSDLYELKQEEENYGSLMAVLKLKFDGPANGTAVLEKQIKEFVKPYKFLTIADKADFQLEVKNEDPRKTASLVDRNNKELWSADLLNNDSLSAEDKKQFIAGIKKALRVKYLRSMPDGGDLAQYVSAEIIPDKEHKTTNEIILEAGDRYSLRISNKSNQNLYYTVLDITPDNNVKVLYPFEGKDPSDYLVENNNVVIRKLAVSKGAPLGVEFLKIIVSKEPMDLRSVFEHTVHRDEMRSFQTVLDDLFNEKQGGGSTRADVSSIKAEEVGIITVNFTIKKQ